MCDQSDPFSKVCISILSGCVFVVIKPVMSLSGVLWQDRHLTLLFVGLQD